MKEKNALALGAHSYHQTIHHTKTTVITARKFYEMSLTLNS